MPNTEHLRLTSLLPTENDLVTDDDDVVEAEDELELEEEWWNRSLVC